MENTESELQHNDVRKEDYLSEIHYFNEVEFYNEFDKLILKYDFLLDIDNSWEDIPKDAVDRYETFKESVARYYYLKYLQEYKDLTLGSEIKTIVTALHQECSHVVNNPRLDENHSEYNSIYLRATRFITDFFVKGNADLVKKYSKEDIETMVYLMHRENYFKVSPIPDAAFDVNSYSNPYAIIAEVYAKYFLFAEFIEPIYNAICMVKEEVEPVAESVPEIKISAKTEIKKETRTVPELINEGYLDKYNILIKTLSDSNPLLKAASKKEFKYKLAELTGYKTDLSCFKKQMVYKIAENKVLLDENYQNLRTFLVYLFSYLIKEGWMKQAESIAATARIINNTFYCKSDENLQINIDRAQFNSILNLMIEGKVPQNNFCLKFIKMIIA